MIRQDIFKIRLAGHCRLHAVPQPVVGRAAAAVDRIMFADRILNNRHQRVAAVCVQNGVQSDIDVTLHLDGVHCGIAVSQIVRILAKKIYSLLTFQISDLQNLVSLDDP